MDIYFCDGHNEHSDDWLFTLPYQETPLCLACLVEILEDNNLLTVKKKPALLQFIKIIQQSPGASQLLKNHLHIVNHILFIFIDLLKLEDAALVSQTLDACMLLLTRLESEELIISVINHIQTQCDKECDFKVLFPFYLFTGRLIQGIPAVVSLLIPQYESLIRHFSDGLNCPDEDVQSALVYIFVYLYEGCAWEMSINSSIHQQLAHQVVSLLNSAKSPALILNTLGLLKKFINSDQTTCMLMKMSFDGVTMVSVLKKFLVSKNDVFKKVSTQILATILSKECSSQFVNVVLQSDIVEFLFEALHTRNTSQLECLFDCIKPLCQMEQFYSKCHSVYGIESILRSLQVLEEMKNLDLVVKGLLILSAILQRQPDSVPLFINSKMVSNCLSVIHCGIKQHQQQVFYTFMTAFLSILRKDHLLLPVPFHELMDILSIISKKIWQYSELKSASMKKSKIKSVTYQPVDSFCQICFASSRLLSSCIVDPKACQSNYEVPDTSNQQQHNTTDSFLQFLIRNCEDTCIPIILNNVQQTKSHMFYQNFFGHLCQLYELDPDQMVLVLERLVSSGFITIILEIKAEMRGPEVDPGWCDKFLMILCHVLQKRDQAIIDWPVEKDFSDIKYSFSDLPTVLSQTSLKMEACDIYIFLLYHTFNNDEMIFSGQDLQYVLLTMLEKRGKWEDLSPLMKKSYIFLWAISACLLDSELQMSEAPDYLIKTLSCEPIESWYTHRQALLNWIYTLESITHSVCIQVVDKWISHLVKETEAANTDVLEDTDIDIEPLIELLVEKKFTNCLVDLLTSSTLSVIRIILHVVKAFCSKSEDEDKRSFLNYLREIIIGTIQEISLQSHDKPKDVNLNSLFDLVLFSYEDLPPSASSSHDIKLIYHIIKWLPSNNLPLTEEKWIQIILHYLTSSEKTLQNRVMSLILQIKEFVVKLENLIEDDSNKYLSTLAVDLVSTIISFSTDLDQYKDRCISINLQCLEAKLRSQDILEVTAYLRLLSTLLEVRFKCPLIQLKYQGCFQYDIHCPLTSQEFKTLFIYLQQLSLQDVNIVKIYACSCLSNMINYLLRTAPLLAEDLLQGPWNSLMMEIIIQTTDLQLSETVNSTLRIIHMFLIHEKTRAFIFQTDDLIAAMAEFLTKLFSDGNKLFDIALLRNILQKVEEVIPKEHSSLKKLFDNVQESHTQVQKNDDEQN